PGGVENVGQSVLGSQGGFLVLPRIPCLEQTHGPEPAAVARRVRQVRFHEFVQDVDPAIQLCLGRWVRVRGCPVAAKLSSHQVRKSLITPEYGWVAVWAFILSSTPKMQ